MKERKIMELSPEMRADPKDKAYRVAVVRKERVTDPSPLVVIMDVARKSIHDR